MLQTRIMSIHRLLVRLFSAFCGGRALDGNVKHFVFDLTCDVIGDPEVIKICFPRQVVQGYQTAFEFRKSDQ